MGAETTNHKKGPRRGAAGRGPKPKMTKEERRKKYTDIARKRREKQNGFRRGEGKSKNFVCYNCRQPGHNAADCPNLGGGSGAENGVCTPVARRDGSSSSSTPATILCYKCGSTEHALHNCPKRHRGDRSHLPFATCFICNEKGHLASACSKNKTGIYVNGGCCRTCGSTQHLATNCPERKKKKRSEQAVDAEKKKEEDEQAIINDLLPVDYDESNDTTPKTRRVIGGTKKKSAASEPKKKKKRVVNF